MNNSTKLSVAVIMGGLSSEKEISLESGRHIYNNLDRDKYEVTPIFMDGEARFWIIAENLVWMNTTADIESSLETGGKKIWYEDLKDFDFVFLGLHGKYAEDGTMFGLLEILDVPYNGCGVLAGALGMDKHMQKQFLIQAGINVPKFLYVTKNNWQRNNAQIIEKLKQEIGYPCIIKPSREGSSTALAKVTSDKELWDGLKKVFHWDLGALIEEDLSDAIEVTTTVLGNENPYSLLPTETPKKGAFLTLEEKFLPGDAKMITPPHLPKKDIAGIQEECVKAYKALGIKVYARIDAFWKNKTLYVLEPNTLPGVTPSTCVFHQAAEAGMNATQFFDKVISLSLEAHRDKIGPL